MDVVLEVEGHDDTAVEVPEAVAGEPCPATFLLAAVRGALPDREGWVVELDGEVLTEGQAPVEAGAAVRLTARRSAAYCLQQRGYAGRSAVTVERALQRGDGRALRLIFEVDGPPCEPIVGKVFERACLTDDADWVHALLDAAPAAPGLLAHLLQAAPLAAAAQQGYLAVVEALLARGVDPDHTSQKPTRRAAALRTPLWCAAVSGHEAVCRVLLAAGADRRAHGPNAPLLVAAGNGHTATCRCLLDAGVDVDDPAGRTALAAALDSGHQDTAVVLLVAGADPNVRLYDGTTVLTRAAKNGSEDICTLLLARGADMHCSHGGGALAAAVAQTFSRTLCERFVAAGADVNARDEDGRTPLFSAAAEGTAEYCRELVAHGADVDATAADGRTALFAAVDNYRPDGGGTLGALVEMGASLRHRDGSGETVVMYAAKTGRDDVLRRLLRLRDAHGMDLDTKDDQGNTALTHAVAAGQEAAATQLVAAGADVGVVGAGGMTVLMVASKGAGVMCEREAGAESGVASIARLLFNAGAPVDATTGDGRTALSIAAMQGNIAMCRFLLVSGADVAARSDDGWTPLHYAAQQGHGSVCRVLALAGAAVDAADADGWTPLMVAAQEGLAEACRVLLELGTRRDATRGSTGATALTYASAEGHSDVMAVLTE